MVDGNAERVSRVRERREDRGISDRRAGRFAREGGRYRGDEHHRPDNRNGSQFHQ